MPAWGCVGFIYLASRNRMGPPVHSAAPYDREIELAP